MTKSQSQNEYMRLERKQGLVSEVCLPSEIKRRLAVKVSGVGKGVLSACEGSQWLPPPRERQTAALDHPQPPLRELTDFADLSLYQRLAQERLGRGQPFLCGGESLEERWDTGEEERGPGRERRRSRKP